jgi:hypothetical protein
MNGRQIASDKHALLHDGFTLDQRVGSASKDNIFGNFIALGRENVALRHVLHRVRFHY